jgi:integrase
MPTLLKRSGSPFWFAAFDVPQQDGTVRRLKKSTQCRKKSDAMTEALRLEAIELKGAISTREEGGKAYSILAEAAESAARGELSESRARALLAKLTENLTGEPLRFYTVRSWSSDWLGLKRSTTKPATLTRYTASVNTFLGWLGEKADSRLEAVTKADVRGFRDAIRTGWKPGRKQGPRRTAKTANAFARDIAGLFRSAVREGLLLASPAAALESLPEDDSTEREVFTVAEVSKLVKAANGDQWQRAIFSARAANPQQEAARCRDWPGLILVGFYSGARLKDAAGLTWRNVDLARGVLDFMPAKTARKRKRLEVPIHPRLAAFLNAHDVPDGKDAPVFPSLAAVRVSGNAGLSSCFGAIMDAAGIDRKTARDAEKDKNGKTTRRAVHARSFHSLRHSLTSSLANLDVAAEIRQRIVGHDTAATHQEYTHTERKTLARAVKKLPNV